MSFEPTLPLSVPKPTKAKSNYISIERIVPEAYTAHPVSPDNTLKFSHALFNDDVDSISHLNIDFNSLLSDFFSNDSLVKTLYAIRHSSFLFALFSAFPADKYSHHHLIQFIIHSDALKRYHHVIVLLSHLDKEHWTVNEYKLAIKAHLKSKPQNITLASELLVETQSRFNIDLKPYFDSFVIQSNWNDHVSKYLSFVQRAHELYIPSTTDFTRLSSSAPSAIQRPRSDLDARLLDLGNAMIQLSINFSKFEYGWSVYESLRTMDKHTFRIIIGLCKRAITHCNTSEGDPETWEGRAWSVYIRAKQSTVPDAMLRVLPQVLLIN
jgi:hypothetical protein